MGYRSHDFFFTYAERMGEAGLLAPDSGAGVAADASTRGLDRWQPQPPGDTWTTVMTWDNFRRPIEYEGHVFGTKELEFRGSSGCPRRPRPPSRLPPGGNEVPRDHWRDLGWSVIDSHSVSGSAEDYRSYIERSRGEFSVAKNVYVGTRCGWFSCRSVCYLASGRPVMIQDTGFSDVVPTVRV